jgi:hypothetical protein
MVVRRRFRAARRNPEVRCTRSSRWIRVNEGDWVWVDFTNASDEMHTIHWHGLILDYRHDGVDARRAAGSAPGYARLRQRADTECDAHRVGSSGRPAACRQFASTATIESLPETTRKQ